jgi:hypothetical protein
VLEKIVEGLSMEKAHEQATKDDDKWHMKSAKGKARFGRTKTA